MKGLPVISEERLCEAVCLARRPADILNQIMSDNRETLRIEISYKTIFFTAAFIAAIWLVFLIKEIIILVFLSVILISALIRPVDWLTGKGIPRAISALLIYLILISFISLGIGIIVPPLIEQTTDLVSSLPTIISAINDFLVFNQVPVVDISKELASQINQIAGNIISISTAVFSSVFNLITLFVLSFYLLVEWKTFIKLVSSPFSGVQERKVASLIVKIEKGLGAWVRGQLALSIIVGVVTYIGLLILAIPFALPLALVAGILEIIPLIGPIISAIPAVLVGLTISPAVALAVIALFIIVQQLENHLIVPMVMSRVVGLQPPIVIIALLIGAKLNGIGGAFLAIPVIIIAKIIFKEFLMAEDLAEEELKD